MHEFIAFLHDMPGQLTLWTQALGPWSYLALFAVVFCETGLVVTPFLPGDSLLFALGALLAVDNAYLHPGILGAVLCLAALSGDCVNFHIGRWLGYKWTKVAVENQRQGKKGFINPNYLLRTQNFFARYGAQTVVFARFAPIVRTYTPFVAGMGQMRFIKFILFSAVGAFFWICGFLSVGYFFGNIPSVKTNFQLVVLGIIFVSFLPALIQATRSRVAKES